MMQGAGLQLPMCQNQNKINYHNFSVSYEGTENASTCLPLYQPQQYKRHKKRDLMKDLEGSLFPLPGLQLCDS